jgi:hypothetical protein
LARVDRDCVVHPTNSAGKEASPIILVASLGKLMDIVDDFFESSETIIANWTSAPGGKICLEAQVDDFVGIWKKVPVLRERSFRLIEWWFAHRDIWLATYKPIKKISSFGSAIQIPRLFCVIQFEILATGSESGTKFPFSDGEIDSQAPASQYEFEIRNFL